MKIRSNGKKAAAPGSASQRRLKCRLAAAVLLLAISAALMALAAKQPGFAEWYSENVYSLFVNSLGRLWGLFPFSVSEIALYILIVVFLLSLAAAGDVDLILSKAQWWWQENEELAKIHEEAKKIALQTKMGLEKGKP